MILTLLKTSRYYLLIFLLTPLLTFAQSSVTMSVSPTVFQMTANPGQEWESTLRIINANPFELRVYAEVANFKPLGESGASEFIPVDRTDDEALTLGEWIRVPEGEIVVPAEEAVQIPIQIQLPDEVPPGGHYAAVLVGTRQNETRDEATQVATSQFVSSLIFLRVSGDVIEDGTIRSFRSLDALTEAPETTFELRFENNGNVHLRPEGEIRIFNMWGQERGFIPVNQKTLLGNVLRDSIRTFTFDWKGDWSPTDIGRYTAIATLAYGEDGRQFTSSETAFWVVPWRLLFGILLTVGVIIWLVSWLLKLYVRRMLSLAGVQENGLSETLVRDHRPRARRVSVVAPIEAGILDLSSQLSKQNTKSSRISVLFGFVSSYRMFFLGVLVVGVSLYLIVWFIQGALTSSRGYQVTFDSAGNQVTLNSEEIAYQQSASSSPTMEKRDVPPVAIINRSGRNGAAADLAVDLEELGYTIATLSTDFDEAREQTVVVYDPVYAKDALELSTVLDNALLSAYPTIGEDEARISVYIGVDIIDR